MDSPDAADDCGRLSLSLVSYGTDEEDVDSITAVENSSDTLIPDILTDSTQKVGHVAVTTFTDEEDLISSIASQLGLSGVTSEKLKEISFALEKMKISQQKFLQSKFILSAVLNIAKAPSKLPQQTVLRINQVINHISLMDYVSPSDLDSTDGMFGLSQNYLVEHLPIELTAVDIKNIQEAVADDIALKFQKLKEMDIKYSDIMSKFSGSGSFVNSNCIEQNSTQELLSLRQDLDHEISVNESYLMESDKILTSLAKLKIEAFDCTSSNKVKHFSEKSDVLKSEIQSLNKQIINGLYHEDQHLIDAYTHLKRNLDLAVNEAKSRLVHLQKKDAEYQKLRGTHFDRLVKEYNDLKSQIAQKEYALNTLAS
ncbi:uncharacterized protein LOC113210609 [Frankliniella occidentalis]|uniref:Uncharacterized protein LOC113210609 n=1 Tax=Frankliniella occidentalis TaxID=133901 RepID=A0A6J1SUF6_FRAOC|nr:uncharacterized protein LOC113210609 [Frankliniella occidentalis]